MTKWTEALMACLSQDFLINPEGLPPGSGFSGYIKVTAISMSLGPSQPDLLAATGGHLPVSLLDNFGGYPVKL